MTGDLADTEEIAVRGRNENFVGGVQVFRPQRLLRDGYAGYGHLTSALHAWCGVHLLRDLKGLYDFEPAQQRWASEMAALLIEARDAAVAARQAGESVLDAAVLRLRAIGAVRGMVRGW